MLTEPLRQATAQLSALGPQRVWSLLVTVFGDLAQAEGQKIAGPVLSDLMAQMHVRPEATRVALHRLRRDDWIVSHKHGRTSLHSLTAHGRAESAAASPRIYAPPQEMSQTWQLVLVESADTPVGPAFVPLMPRVYIGEGDAKVPGGALCFAAQNAPDWLRKQIEPTPLATEYAALERALAALEAALPHDLTPPSIAVLRCLIVHSWRRLILRHPLLPPQLYTESWRGHACQARVATLLARLPRPKLSDFSPS